MKTPMQKNQSNLTSFGTNFATEDTLQIACDSIKTRNGDATINQGTYFIEFSSKSLPNYLNDGVLPMDPRLSTSLATIFLEKYNNLSGITVPQLQEWRFRRLQDTRMIQ